MSDRTAEGRFGLSCALLTPFDGRGAVDTARLTAHAASRLAAGCSSVTVFGTTGEGTSLGDAARAATLDALRREGIAMEEEVIVGIAATSIDAAIAQAHQASSFGCRTLLLAPPFYFKDVGDEGLARWFSIVLDAIGEHEQRAILYHIPSVTMIGLSQDLIERLKARYARTVAGIKDSSGDWGYAQELLARHKDLAILIGDERRLAAAVRMGAQGAISGLANLAPELLLPLAQAGRDDPRVTKVVDEILRYPVVPAVKELCAHLTGDGAWRTAAPPLEPLSRTQANRLCAAFDAAMVSVPA